MGLVVDSMLEGRASRLNENMTMLMVLVGRREGVLVYNVGNLAPLVVQLYFARISHVNGGN